VRPRRVPRQGSFFRKCVKKSLIVAPAIDCAGFEVVSYVTIGSEIYANGRYKRKNTGIACEA
jgi:hypothetical protein